MCLFIESLRPHLKKADGIIVVVMLIITSSLKYYAAMPIYYYYMKTEKQKNYCRLTITAGIKFIAASKNVLELMGSMRSFVYLIVYTETELFVYIELVIFILQYIC